MQIWHYSECNPGAVGGVESLISNLSTFFNAAGLSVHSGISLPKHFSESERTVIHTHGDLWLKPNALRQFKKSFSNSKLVHIGHGTSIGRMFFSREFHKVSTWKGSLKDYLCLLFSDAYVAVSKQAAKEVETLFRIKKPHAVICNGVNPDIFLETTKITPEPAILFAGRASDRVKNISFLLTACDSLQNKYPDLKLHVAPGLEKTTKSYLKNLGQLTPHQLAHELRYTRALVLCSFYEGDPIILREAQAVGIPIIASDLPQIRENLAGYSNAFFIDPRKIDTLIAALELVLAKSTVFHSSARIRSWKTVANEYLSFYKSLF